MVQQVVHQLVISLEGPRRFETLHFLEGELGNDPSLLRKAQEFLKNSETPDQKLARMIGTIRELAENAQREAIKVSLILAKGDVKRAAKTLGMNQQEFTNMLKSLSFFQAPKIYALRKISSNFFSEWR